MHASEAAVIEQILYKKIDDSSAVTRNSVSMAFAHEKGQSLPQPPPPPYLAAINALFGTGRRRRRRCWRLRWWPSM